LYPPSSARSARIKLPESRTEAGVRFHRKAGPRSRKTTTSTPRSPKTLLEANATSPSTARLNGLKALEKFVQSPEGTYAAILMDVRMPLMDGLQTAANIRHWDRPDAKKIPIVAMTANAFDEDVEKSRAAGMNAHLDILGRKSDSMELTKEQLQLLVECAPEPTVVYLVRDGQSAPVPFLYSSDVPAFSGLSEREYLELYRTTRKKSFCRRIC
jgi:CheY-like chemotaxis protein